MLLTDVRPADGARRNRKRVGRGRASGHGKTSTRGHNGQGQRSGESKRFGFEGGQTPLFRRLPKLHNFDEVITRIWVEVNVGALNSLSANSEVTADSLVEAGILRKTTSSLRILGNGELKVALKVKAHHISEGAKKKIEAAGGSVELIVANIVEGKRSEAKRTAKAVRKKDAETAAAQAEKKAAEEAKKEKAAGGGAAKTEKSDKGGQQQQKGGAPKGGSHKPGDKKSGKPGDKKK